MKIQIKTLIAILLLFAVAATLFGLFIKQGNVRNLPEIRKAGRLRVIADNSAMGFNMAQGSAYGFGYEIIKSFADSLGVELEISEIENPALALNRLKNNEFDIAIVFVPIVEKHRQDLILTNSFLSYRQMLVQNKNANKLVKKQYELAGDTVYIEQNSFYGERFENMIDEIADTVFFTELANVNVEKLVSMTARGEIGKTVCPEILVNKFAKQYPELDFSLPLSFLQQHAWAVNRNAPMLAKKFDEFLDNFIESTQYWELYQKYF
ncbi:MAG: transporter substrate-binding domain-containing protein [Paludibacter sp.]|jgi:membrane-bound lytic murein transglycosylase F|nr:transporter substrate-binding domain-containing protein [Paludibacter sp.]